jgi:excisionase family DNA binding protein
VLRVKDVAQRLDCSISTVYGLVSDGLLACIRVGIRGGAIRFTEEDLQAYVQSRRVEGKATPDPKPAPNLNQPAEKG